MRVDCLLLEDKILCSKKERLVLISLDLPRICNIWSLCFQLAIWSLFCLLLARICFDLAIYAKFTFRSLLCRPGVPGCVDRMWVNVLKFPAICSHTLVITSLWVCVDISGIRRVYIFQIVIWSYWKLIRPFMLTAGKYSSVCLLCVSCMFTVLCRVPTCLHSRCPTRNATVWFLIF